MNVTTWHELFDTVQCIHDCPHPLYFPFLQHLLMYLISQGSSGVVLSDYLHSSLPFSVYTQFCGRNIYDERCTCTYGLGYMKEIKFGSEGM